MQRLFYDPSFAQPVPSDRVDAVSVFEHEIGHGLGIISYVRSDGSLPSDRGGSYEYAADRYVTEFGGSPVFVGPNSEAAYSGPVPLSDDRSHLAIGGDVMESASAYGLRRFISDTDLGHLQDEGLPIATDRVDTLLLGSANDTFKAFGGNDTVGGGLGNDLVYGNLGDDLIYGNQGSDVLFGGQGNDVDYGGRDGDVVYGNLGDDRIYGNLGNDRPVRRPGRATSCMAAKATTRWWAGSATTRSWAAWARTGSCSARTRAMT